MDDTEDEAVDLSIVGQIRTAVKEEGIEKGTKEFDKRFRQLHVIRCREMRGHETCQDCPYHESCDLYISVKRDYLGE